MTIIARMLSVDRQEMLILAMLSRYFIALYRLIDLRGSTDSSEIARQAKIPPFAVGEHFDALDRIGAARVERGLRALQTAEATLKSSSADPLAVLQRMIADVFEVEDKR
jgi:DNA polymerase III delta subunit